MEGISLGDYIKTQKEKQRGGKFDKKRKFEPKKKNLAPKKEREVEPGLVKKPHPETQKKSLILVEELPESYQNKELKTLFSKYGELTRCNILFDKKGDSKVY